MATSHSNAVQKLCLAHIPVLTKVVNVWRQKNSVALYAKASIRPRILGAKIGKKS